MPGLPPDPKPLKPARRWLLPRLVRRVIVLLIAVPLALIIAYRYAHRQSPR